MLYFISLTFKCIFASLLILHRCIIAYLKLVVWFEDMSQQRHYILIWTWKWAEHVLFKMLNCKPLPWDIDWLNVWWWTQMSTVCKPRCSNYLTDIYHQLISMTDGKCHTDIQYFSVMTALKINWTHQDQTQTHTHTKLCTCMLCKQLETTQP